MPTRMKKGALVQSRNRRREPAKSARPTPPASLAVPPPQAPLASVAEVKALHRKALAESLMAGLVAQGRALGIEVIGKAEARSNWRRHRRALDKLATVEAGRDAIADIAERMCSPIVRGTLRELVQATRDGVAVPPKMLVASLFDAVDIGEQAIEEFVTSSSATARDWGTIYRLHAARLVQATGRATALRFDTRTLTIRETDDKRSITTRASLQKDAGHEADRITKSAEYALRMLWACNAEAEQTEQRRRRELHQRSISERIAADRARAEAERAEDDDDDQDVGGGLADSPADDEHGLPPTEERNPFASEASVGGRDDVYTHDDARRVPGASRPDHDASPDEEPTATALNAFIADQQFCRVRNRMVWGALANTPLPSGPNYPERRAEEARAIADWDKRMSIARHTLQTKSRQR